MERERNYAVSAGLCHDTHA